MVFVEYVENYMKDHKENECLSIIENQCDCEFCQEIILRIEARKELLLDE